MSNLGDIRLFATHPHECSYLEDQQAVSVFVDPAYPITEPIYSKLSERGFRRSGSHIYRPHCRACRACVPARIPVASYSMSRREKRCLKKNLDLTVSCTKSIDSEQHYQLYRRYIEQRHNDGDMYPPSREQYDSFLSDEWGVTEYLQWHNAENDLLMVAVCDRMQAGYSAVYTFFEPDEADRGLGTLAVLWQISLCQALGLPHVYLGYWIKNCQKMNYKTNFKPLELMMDGRWIKVS